MTAMAQAINTTRKTIKKPDQLTGPAGYSGTPLSKKMGIKPGQQVCLIHAPDDYVEWLQPLPEGVVFRTRPDEHTELVHLFVNNQTELLKKLQQLRHGLDVQTPVWVSWPKKASGMNSDVSEDTIREVALPLGYVDIKVCAVNAIWSGLKLVVRKELR